MVCCSKDYIVVKILKYTTYWEVDFIIKCSKFMYALCLLLGCVKAFLVLFCIALGLWISQAHLPLDDWWHNAFVDKCSSPAVYKLLAIVKIFK